MDERAPPDDDDDDDASAALSDYSSCEGSEFDKYCSANSALGSASCCSSTTNYAAADLSDSSLRHIENRNIRDKFWRSRWNYEPPESPRTNPDPLAPSKLSSNGDSSAAAAPRCAERVDLDENSGPLDPDRTAPEADELDADGLSDGDCSEDEMLDYGSDAGRQIRMSRSEPKSENENPLLINSSVAYGSDDWDEFVQETGGNDFGMLTLQQDRPVKHEQELLDGVGSQFPDEVEQQQDAREIPTANYQAEDAGLSSQEEGGSPVANPFRDYEAVRVHKTTTEQRSHLNFEYDGSEREVQSSCTVQSSEEQVFGEIGLPRSALQFHSNFPEVNEGEEVGTLEFDGVGLFQLADKNGPDSSLQRAVEGNSNSVDTCEEDILSGEVKKLDGCDLYDDMVLEMEEILLDSGKSYGARFTQANQGHISQQSRQFRDGSSTASTSGTDDTYLAVHSKIDWVEVVGAKQRKGDVSFGERLVGVKEYTEYKLRVCSGMDLWEVGRRYRDFYALYRQLKTLFAEHGLNLPSPWSDVERESRKIFGNASPAVITERSTLIQNCLRSILNSGCPFGTPYSLICFLSPNKSMHSSGFLEAPVPRSLQNLMDDEKSKGSNSERFPEDISMFGKTISLVAEIKPHKSTRQLLEAQHYRCAGCHRQLDAGKTLLREFVQTLGWNKPRLCEYTGQLFCASCHTNDTAVLPARVLNLWDFSLYPVSQLAKAYLGSTYDQPMLCVSAVNPFLYSKVPALLQVVNVRKKIGAMLPFVRCPFRRSIQRGLGLRRHLLESNDFFALRDLVDLSKGAFAALPIMLETISSKIFVHITQQCLECYDSGVPCAARQACADPSSLIFPFQEDEAKKCGSCGSIFHKPCFLKHTGCHCGKPTTATSLEVSRDSEALNGTLQGSKETPETSSTSGFFSAILSKARPDKIWKPKDRPPVILMGSLPDTSL